MTNIQKDIIRLKKIIQDTAIDKLDSLKDSICVSSYHPDVKRVALEDIDYKQNMMVYANDAVSQPSEGIDYE